MPIIGDTHLETRNANQEFTKDFSPHIYGELMPKVYECGCVNKVDREWRILRRLFTCNTHKEAGGKTGLQHYIDMGCIVDGVPQRALHVAELRAAMDEMGIVRSSHRNERMLEIGSGLSLCAQDLRSQGYIYTGIEPDKEAAEWARQHSDGSPLKIIETNFEEYSGGTFKMILAAHVFEHMDDAPVMISKAFRMLSAKGRLLLVVPNGEDDPVNPDHLWQFTPSTLRSTLDRIGFTDVRMVEKRIVERERFIYCSAVKP